MSDARLLSGIEVLVAIVETGSLKRASQVLGLSNSGVSRALARLEARLGMRLIERTTRSLRLTEVGTRFYAEVAPLSAQIAEAATMLADAGRAVRGRLRVELDPYFSRLVFAPGSASSCRTIPTSNWTLSRLRHPAISSRMALTVPSVSANLPIPASWRASCSTRVFSR